MSVAAHPQPEAPPLPREIQLEVTGACNLRCRMCLVRYRPPLGRRTASLDLALFRRVVDALPDLERVTLQGLGEPLLAPDLVAMVAYAAGRGIRVGFNTNGTLLTRERARDLIAAGLAWLHVSIDGATEATYEGIRDGSSLARVQANVASLMEEIAGSGRGLPDVSLVFVAMRRNVRELPDVVRLAATWGVPRLHVQNLSHSFSDTSPESAYREIRDFFDAEALWPSPPGEREASIAFAAARRAAEECGIELHLPRLESEPAARAPGSPGCDWPWRSSYVRHDGRVQPCCMLMGDDRAIQGSVATHEFQEVWRGSAYASFRAQLEGSEPPAVCRGCALYQGVF
ncbi:MAG: radical SAM protein [Thermodesulfobacteriota bacterium]